MKKAKVQKVTMKNLKEQERKILESRDFSTIDLPSLEERLEHRLNLESEYTQMKKDYVKSNIFLVRIRDSFLFSFEEQNPFTNNDTCVAIGDE